MNRVAKQRTAGFTLIEMLVVIGLIGVLTSVLVVAVVYAKSVSIQLECKNQLSQIGKTMHTMALSNGGQYPELIDDDGIPWWAHVYQEWDSATTLGEPGQLPSLMNAFHCRAGGDLANFELSASGTATGGGATWLTDGSLVAGQHIGSLVRITNSSTPRAFRRITGNDGTDLSFNRRFPENPGNGSDYEIISFENTFNSISYGLNFDVMRENRVVDNGTASGGSSDTLIDVGMTWSNDEHIGRKIEIINGPSFGEQRKITDNWGDTLEFAVPFSTNPGVGTEYRIISSECAYSCVADSNVLEMGPDPLWAADKDPDTYAYTEIVKPAEFILISEADTQDENPANWTGSRISMGAITRGGGDFPSGNAPIPGRHRGHANVLFADTHVEALEVSGGDNWTRNVNGNTSLWTLPDD